MPNKILAFAGSTRQGSYNRAILDHAVVGARAGGSEVTLIDLRDYSLPLYNGDLEISHGIPDSAARLKELFKSHDGLLLACPEYNSSITPLLKNTLDWVSRPHGQESGLVPYQGKFAMLIAASAGNLGGLRGLRHVREILTALGVMVLPAQLAVSQADQVLPDNMKTRLHDTGAELAQALQRWHGR